jgi:hypothetical protein
VSISLADLERQLGELKHQHLLPPAKVFAENLKDLGASLRLPYAVLAYGNFKGMTFARHSGKLWARRFSGASEADISTLAYSLGQQSVEQVHSAEDLGIDGNALIDEFHAVFVNHEAGLGGFKSQLKAAILLSWSAFENLSADLWVDCLNTYPQALMSNIAHSDPSQPDQKKIEIWQLQRYEYDLRGHMGTVLKDRYKFTDVDGIRKAYVDVFGPARKSEIDGVLRDPDLNFLEAARHNVAHRAGVTDSRFLSRIKNYPSFTSNEGEPLPLTGSFVSRLVSAAVEAGCVLVKSVDGWLPENATPMDETPDN